MPTKRITADQNIDKVIALCNDLIEMADLGEDSRLDNCCDIFYNALRDSAYKIRRMAKLEHIRHEENRYSPS